jgi:hypothetical protein
VISPEGVASKKHRLPIFSIILHNVSRTDRGHRAIHTFPCYNVLYRIVHSIVLADANIQHVHFNYNPPLQKLKRKYSNLNQTHAEWMFYVLEFLLRSPARQSLYTHTWKRRSLLRTTVGVRLFLSLFLTSLLLHHMTYSVLSESDCTSLHSFTRAVYRVTTGS